MTEKIVDWDVKPQHNQPTFELMKRHFILCMHICITVLQPGFKKGRVHIIKRALSSREAASEGECGRGYPPLTGGGVWGISPKEIFENRT